MTKGILVRAFAPDLNQVYIFSTK